VTTTTIRARAIVPRNTKGPPLPGRAPHVLHFRPGSPPTSAVRTLRRLRLPSRGRRRHVPRDPALPRLDRLAAFVSGQLAHHDLTGGAELGERKRPLLADSSNWTSLALVTTSRALRPNVGTWSSPTKETPSASAGVNPIGENVRWYLRPSPQYATARHQVPQPTPSIHTCWTPGTSGSRSSDDTIIFARNDASLPSPAR